MSRALISRAQAGPLLSRHRDVLSGVCRGLVVSLVVAALLVVMPATEARAGITSDGPLTNVTISPYLNCSVNHVLDASPEWYGTTACATLVSLNGILFGPSSIPAGGNASPKTTYTTVSQSPVTGTGTDADPYTIVTVVRAGTYATLTQTDTYVVGEELYDTSVTVSNDAGFRLIGQVYTAGDCYLQSSDAGYGRISGTSPACTTSTLPGSRVEQLLPRTGGNSYYQAQYSNVWAAIGAQGPFPNTCVCTTRVDNGIGIAWPVDVPTGENRTWEWSTVFSPLGQVPLVVSATPHASANHPSDANGYRVTVSNVNAVANTLDTLTVTLPEGFSYTPGTTVGATTADPAVTDRTLTWTGPFTVPTGGVITVDFQVTTSSEAGTYTIDADAASSTAEVTPTNDTAPITIQAVADMSIAKSASVTDFVAGTGGYTYSVVASNAGPSAVLDAFVTDTLPSGLTLNQAASTPGCFVLAGQVRCDVGTLAAGESNTVTIAVTVPDNAGPGIASNMAVVGPALFDPDMSNNSASTSVTITRESDLSVTKTANPTSVGAGGNVTFPIVVRNAGPSTATAIALDDVLPTHLQATALTGTGCTLATLHCTFELRSGAQTTVNLTARADASLTAGTVLTNHASVAVETSDDRNPANDTANASITITEDANVGITKTASPAGLVAGGTGTFLLTATNAGPANAPGTVVTDTLPAGVTFNAAASSPGCTAVGDTVTCVVGTLAPSASASLNIVVDIPASTAAGASVSDTAAITSDRPDSAPANNTATAVGTVTREADLSLTKQTVEEAFIAGSTATYDLTVVNRGPSDATDVVVEDTTPSQLIGPSATVAEGTGSCVPGQPLRCTFPSLPANGTATVRVAGTVDPGTPPATVISNTATVTGTEPDPTTGDNTTTNETSVQVTTGLAVTKVDGAVPAVAGRPLSYTITVTNEGPSTATGVSLVDALPAGFTATTATADNGATCTTSATEVRCEPLAETLGVGSTVTVSLDGDVDSSVAHGAELTDSVTVSDDSGASVTETENTEVIRQATVSVDKTPTASQVVAGTPVTWNVVVANDGPSDVSDAVLVDAPSPAFAITGFTPPAGTTCDVGTRQCTIANLPAGRSETIGVTGTVSPDAPAGPLTNAVTVSTPTGPSDSTSESVDVVQTSDLVLTKASEPRTVASGETVRHLLTLVNRGPSTATNAEIVDMLPPGLTFDATGSSDGCTAAGQVITCPVGTLAPNAGAIVTVAATTDPALDGVVTDTATASADQTDDTPPSAGTETTVSPATDLSISKSANQVSAGENLTWTIAVTNPGPSSATGVAVTDTLPDRLTFVSATPDGAGTCTYDAPTRAVRCDLGTMTAPSTRTVTLVAGTPPDLLAPGTVIGAVHNAAHVTAATPDTDPSNNHVEGGAVVVATAQLAVTKTASPQPAVAGADISYDVTVTNTGPSTATGPSVDDALPAEVTFRPASSDPRCTLLDAGTNVIRCLEPGTLDAGASTVFRIVAHVRPDLGSGSTLVNTAVATGAELGEPAEDSTTSIVSREAAIGISVLAFPAVVAPDDLDGGAALAEVPAGAPFSFGIAVMNQGPSTATDLEVRSVLPQGTGPLQGGLRPGLKGIPDCPVTGLTVECRIPALAPGDTTIIVVPYSTAPGTAAGTTIPLEAEAVFAEAEPGAGPVTDGAAVTITRESSLSFTKTPLTSPVRAGETVTWAVDVSNAGPSDAGPVTIDDPLSPGMTFVAAGSSPECTPAGGNDVRCTIAQIAAGASTRVLIAAAIAPDVTGDLTNTATLINPEDRTATIRTTSGTVAVEADMAAGTTAVAGTTADAEAEAATAAGALPATGASIAVALAVALGLVAAGVGALLGDRSRRHP